MSFQHRRLSSSRSIRLLSLRPSSYEEALIKVTLSQVSLDQRDLSAYEALSYVWGLPSGTIRCECDGQDFLITPNCSSALRHLRLPDKERTLWVDAICIDQGANQASIDERNYQIALMGEIYRGAARTLCWLGEGVEYTKGTFDRLRRIGSCPSKRGLMKLLDYDKQLRQKSKLEEGSTCLNHIFCHSWHSRIWTLQEVAFSEDCRVICGKESISWELYIAAAKFLVFDEFIDELEAQAWKSYVSMKVREDIRDSIFVERQASEHETTVALVTSALTQVRHLQATNPKDKIYGLYAVFIALSIPLPAPDYWKSLERVYEEACLAIIFHSRTLQMLQYACSNARSPSLPSWVPDWQDENVTLKNPVCYATDDSRISAKSLVALSPSSGKLLVRGQSFGMITTRTANAFVSHEFPSDSLPILRGEKYDLVGEEVDSLRLLIHRVKLFREWMGVLEGIANSLLEEGGDFFHHLITFEGEETMISESADVPLFNAWREILQYPDTEVDLSDGEALVGKWEMADLETETHWESEMKNCATIAAHLTIQSLRPSNNTHPFAAQLLDFTAHLSGNMGNRRLILVHDKTLDATLPGTAFHTAQIDDFVVLLEGSSCPVALRQQEGELWSFVGPAYVSGFMDGEAWPEEDEEVEMQDFVLI